jgi:hypothetical protein
MADSPSRTRQLLAKAKIMGHHLTRRVWESALPAALKPLMALIAHLVRDDESRGRAAMTLFATVATLARYLGIDQRNVRRALCALLGAGVLEIVERGGGRRRFGKRVGGVATTYVVHPERLPDWDDERPQADHARVREARYPDVDARVDLDTRTRTPEYNGVNPGEYALPISGVRTAIRTDDRASDACMSSTDDYPSSADICPPAPTGSVPTVPRARGSRSASPDVAPYRFRKDIDGE